MALFLSRILFSVAVLSFSTPISFSTCPITRYMKLFANLILFLVCTEHNRRFHSLNKTKGSHINLANALIKDKLIIGSSSMKLIFQQSLNHQWIIDSLLTKLLNKCPVGRSFYSMADSQLLLSKENGCQYGRIMKNSYSLIRNSTVADHFHVPTKLQPGLLILKRLLTALK